jgi:hypothetical protein
MGLMGGVIEIAIAMALVACVSYVTMRYLLRPLLASTCLLMASLCLAGIVYAIQPRSNYSIYVHIRQ